MKTVETLDQAARPARRARALFPSWLGWLAATGAAITGVLAVVGAINPRFFYVDDKQNQFMPMMVHIGDRLRGGRLPVIEPDLGPSGNFALDPQYGVFDPMHWLVAVAMSYASSAFGIVWASFGWSAAFLLVFGVGTAALLLRLGVDGWWATTGGLASATSGFVLYWLSPNWTSTLASVAWLPWWLCAVHTRRTTSAAVAAISVTAFLVVVGGWPFAWVFAAAAMAGVAVEAWARRPATGRTADWLRPLLVRASASAAGAAAGLITVVPLVSALESTVRRSEVTNSGFLVPNLADVLAFAAPTLRGEINSFGTTSLAAPVFFAGWFAVVLLWTTPWSRAVLRAPGVLSALVPLLVTLLLTQSPSDLGPLRWPLRHLVGVQLFLIVFATAAARTSGDLRVRAGRTAAVVATVAATGLLAWFRAPQVPGHLFGTAAVLVAAAGVLAALRTRPRLAGAVALGVSLVLISGNIARHPEPVGADRGLPAEPGAPVLDLSGREPILALYPRGINGVDRAWFGQGVGVGMARLPTGPPMQPGYSSIGQERWWVRFNVLSAHGYTRPNAVRRLFRTEATTGERWIDLLGLRTVVVHDGEHLDVWRSVDTDGWRRVGRSRDFVVFARTEPITTPGRITAVLGDADISARAVTDREQSYAVRAPSGATLVLRDVFWPGYHATLDGRAVEVRPFRGTLVAVRLPPGADGTLTVRYDALDPTLTGACAIAAATLLLAALVLARPVRRGASQYAATRVRDRPDHGAGMPPPP